MASKATNNLRLLAMRLQVEGPQTAVELAAAVGVHRSQVSRELSRGGDSVVQIGAARRARYALRRQVSGAGDRWPVFRVGVDGGIHEWFHLEAFHGGYRLQWKGAQPAWADHVADVDGWTDVFPFFLDELRPQGFIGRILARRLSGSLYLPSDPTHWSDVDTLVFLQAEGGDLPGDLILGETALRHELACRHDPPALISHAEREIRYPEMAIQAMHDGIPGSSAGGEQPKFLVRLQEENGEVSAVLVKFSPPVETESGRRWADLLIAEAHAGAVLAEVEEGTSRPRILEAGGRVFLEVPRFDRVGPHGRRGVISLAALHAACSDHVSTDWVRSCGHLIEAGLLNADVLAVVRRRQAFGELIGNTDMHMGNLAFWRQDDLPFRLAPSYDMLPMLWAPASSGEMVDRIFAPLPPSPAQRADWSIAAEWASRFWSSVAADSRVSSAFAAIANRARIVVEDLRRNIS